jgi:hypothetical protein
MVVIRRVETYVGDVQCGSSSIDKCQERRRGAYIDQSQQDLDHDRQHDSSEGHLGPRANVRKIVGSWQTSIARKCPGGARTACHQSEVCHDHND